MLKIIKYLGFKWFVFRVFFFLKKELGVFKFLLPANSWKKVLLNSFIKVDYLNYKKKNAKFFQFKMNSYNFYNSLEEVKNIEKGIFKFYSYHNKEVGFPPNWFIEPFFHKSFPFDSHWSLIDDFKLGDIKNVYELSRFSFVYPLLRAYFQTKDEKYPKIFWQIFEDWKLKNQPNQGVNWKCGQEISFRSFALIFAFYGFLNSRETSEERLKGLAQVIYFSSMRIKLTLDYALSQNNNHGISESSALFIIGTLFPEFKNSEKIKNLGRKHFIQQVDSLIYEDGLFSQHSFNYQRLVIDILIFTLRLAELNNENFSLEIYDKLYKSANSLYLIMDKETGQLPNYGGNDGALLFSFTNCKYEDYRSSIQAAFVLTKKERVLKKGGYDEALFWFDLKEEKENFKEILSTPSYHHFQNGGLVLIQQENYKIIISCKEEFKHRPNHLDNLHLDLWYKGKTVLCDIGSYSYNANSLTDYFIDSKNHNLVAFDCHSQMPKISKFLYGYWKGVKILNLSQSKQTIIFEGIFKDYKNCILQRKVESSPNQIIIKDLISNFKKEATLTWNLDSSFKWEQENIDQFKNNEIKIEIIPNTARYILKKEMGFKSLYYMDKKIIDVLKLRVLTDCTEIITKITLN